MNSHEEIKQLQKEIEQLKLQNNELQLKVNSLSEDAIIATLRLPNTDLHNLQQKFSALESLLKLDFLNPKIKEAIILELKTQIHTDFKNYHKNENPLALWKNMYFSSILLTKWQNITDDVIKVLIYEELSNDESSQIKRSSREAALEYLAEINLAPFLFQENIHIQSYLQEHTELLKSTSLHALFNQVFVEKDYLPYYPSIIYLIKSRNIQITCSTDGDKYSFIENGKSYVYEQSDIEKNNSFFLKLDFSLKTSGRESDADVIKNHADLDWLHQETRSMEIQNSILEKFTKAEKNKLQALSLFAGNEDCTDQLQGNMKRYL